VNREVPPELARLVARMMAKSPDIRHATASDLCADLRALRQGSISMRTAPATPARYRPGMARAPRYAAIFLACAAFAVIGYTAYRHFSAPALNEHATLLVTDFDNQTHEKLFDATVAEAMRQALEQSRYVEVVRRAQIAGALERMGHSASTRVDSTIGRQICRREGFNAMLAGQVTGASPPYSIAVELVEPSRDDPVWTQTASLRSPSQLYSTVDRLAGKLRARLGESLQQVESSTPLARVTTPSLEALERYSKALDYFAAGDYQSFLPLAQSAVELDPNFAMAHLYLARAYDWLGDENHALKELELAKSGISHVSEPERHQILAEDYDFHNLPEKAAEEYRLLTELYPDDPEGYEGIAREAYWTGQSQLAIQAARKAIQLNSHDADNYAGLILLYDRVNQFSDALATFEKARSLGLSDPRLLRGAGIAWLGQGDTAKARAEFDAIGRQGGPIEQSLSNLYLARVLMYDGRLREAADSLRTGLILDQKMRSASWSAMRRYLLARTLLLSGKRKEARALLPVLLADARDTKDPDEMCRTASIAADMGDTGAAQRMLALFPTLGERGQTSYAQGCYYALQASIEQAQGRSAQAAADVQRSIAYYSSPYPYLILARARSDEHDWAGAADAYRQYIGGKGEILSDDSPAQWVAAHLAMARALAQAGDAQKSRAAYSDFLALWAHGDSDLAPLTEARNELRKMDAALSRDSQRSFAAQATRPVSASP
jgi:eukaryotic-like serine/threonine-protein kinase